MVAPSRPPSNWFVAAARHVYNPIGFSKGYNFVLWFIFAGGLLGFICARSVYLDYDGVYCGPNPTALVGAAPGECWAYGQEAYLKLGIKLHLWTVIPAGFLAFLQFVPVIRHKVILFHRINGYVTILLSIVGTAAALMIARVSFGGGLEIQAAVGLLAILFVGSLLIALYNIKRLQLEQHRAWMLRAWFYSGAIISCRIIMVAAAMIISFWGDPVHKTFSCDKLASFYEDNEKEFLKKYPICKSRDEYVPVEANMIEGGEENMGAALDVTFGMAVWLAMAIHGLGVEIYLHLTPAEFERLRNISYRRQMEAGLKKPGSAGLTADRLGDSAPWVPAIERNQQETQYALVQNVAKTDIIDESQYDSILLRPANSRSDLVAPRLEDTRYDPGR